MRLQSCHTFINSHSGEYVVFAIHPRLGGYQMCLQHAFMTRLRAGDRPPWLHFAAPVYSRDDMAYGAKPELQTKL